MRKPHLMLRPWHGSLGGSSRRSWRRGGRRRRGASCWRGGTRTRKPSGFQPDPCPALARPFTRIPIFFSLTSPVFSFTLIFSHLSFLSYTFPHGYFLLRKFVFMLVSYFVLVVLCLPSCFLTFQYHFHCMSFLSSPVDRRRATPFLVLPIPGSLRLPSTIWAINRDFSSTTGLGRDGKRLETGKKAEDGRERFGAEGRVQVGRHQYFRGRHWAVVH